MPAKKNFIKNAIRRIMPVIFLIVFFMPVSSTYFLFKIRQTGIRQSVEKTMDEGGEEHRIEVLKIPFSVEKQGDFERTEENEFRYKGKMYDVVRLEKHGNSTWYWCMWDEDETALEDKLSVAEGRAAGAFAYNENTEEMISFFLNSLYIHNSEYVFYFPVKYLIATRPSKRYIRVNRSLTPPTPPPQV